MKVVIDTNWLISYLINKQAGSLNLIFIDLEISIVSTEKQIREFLNKVHHEKFRKYFKIEVAIEFIQNFAKRSDFISVTSTTTICRDSKDNYLLSLSKDSKAHYLITGDKDLLELQQFEGTIICTLQNFIEKNLSR